MDASDLQHRIRQLLEPAVERLGFDLVAVEWLGAQHGRVLRLSVEKSGGVSAGDCTRVSHYVSPVLDEADPIASAYVLEVSSPGIDRPVQRFADYQRFIGFRVKIRLVDGHPRRRYTGRIVQVEDQLVHVEVDGVVHPVAFEAIERANLVMDLDEYQQLAEVSNDDQ